MRRTVVALTTLLGLSALSMGQTAVRLWPHGAPGERATSEPLKDATTEKDGKPAGRRVERLANVTDPDIAFFPAPEENNSKAAMLVFPGGGYRILAADLEGVEVCEWLNRVGVNAFLVRYRVPQPKDVARYAQPLQDAQRAMGYVRSRADELHLRSDQIGALGFSAGGHLLAALSNGSGQRTYPPVDAADKLNARPDFVLLIYPAYLSVGDKGSELAPEVQPRGTPPTFIVQTEDDKNFIGGTLLYYRALRDAGVPAEMHIFPHGGHGYGLRHTDDAVTDWPKLAERWMRGLGMVGSTISGSK